MTDALHYVDTNDPRVKKAARELELTMIQRAYILDGTLYIITPYDHHELPAHGFGKTDTLPTPLRGSNDPASPASGRHPTGGSAPPQAPASATDAEPEPPHSSPPGRGQGEGTGLDDFTAIDGVGPVTAQKLHNLGYYTYDDLRLLPDIIDTPTASISSTRIQQIKAWLDQRLV